MDLFNVYDLEKRTFHVYNSRCPLNSEGLCNTALEPLDFSFTEINSAVFLESSGSSAALPQGKRVTVLFLLFQPIELYHAPSPR